MWGWADAAAYWAGWWTSSGVAPGEPVSWAGWACAGFVDDWIASFEESEDDYSTPVYGVDF